MTPLLASIGYSLCFGVILAKMSLTVYYIIKKKLVSSQYVLIKLPVLSETGRSSSIPTMKYISSMQVDRSLDPMLCFQFADRDNEVDNPTVIHAAHIKEQYPGVALGTGGTCVGRDGPVYCDSVCCC